MVPTASSSRICSALRKIIPRPRNPRPSAAKSCPKPNLRLFLTGASSPSGSISRRWRASRSLSAGLGGPSSASTTTPTPKASSRLLALPNVHSLDASRTRSLPRLLQGVRRRAVAVRQDELTRETPKPASFASISPPDCRVSTDIPARGPRRARVLPRLRADAFCHPVGEASFQDADQIVRDRTRWHREAGTEKVADSKPCLMEAKHEPSISDLRVSLFADPRRTGDVVSPPAGPAEQSYPARHSCEPTACALRPFQIVLRRRVKEVAIRPMARCHPALTGLVICSRAGAVSTGPPPPPTR